MHAKRFCYGLAIFMASMIRVEDFRQTGRFIGLEAHLIQSMQRWLMAFTWHQRRVSTTVILKFRNFEYVREWP